MMPLPVITIIGASLVSLFSAQAFPNIVSTTGGGSGPGFASHPGLMFASLNRNGMPQSMRNTGPVISHHALRNTGPSPASTSIRNAGPPLHLSGQIRNAGILPPPGPMRNAGPMHSTSRMRPAGPSPSPGQRSGVPPSGFMRNAGPVPLPGSVGNSGPLPSQGMMGIVGPVPLHGLMRNAGPVPPHGIMRSAGPVPPHGFMRNLGSVPPPSVSVHSGTIRNTGQSIGSMQNRAAQFNSGLPNIASLATGPTTGTTSPGGFSLGVTEDGQEGYYGPSGGNDAFPYLGGAGQGEQYGDGGVMAGVGNGYGAGSYMAFLEKQRLGINDPFPTLVGPPYQEVWSRYLSSLPNGAAVIPSSGLNGAQGSNTGMATAGSPGIGPSGPGMRVSPVGPAYMVPAGPTVMMTPAMRIPPRFF